MLASALLPRSILAASLMFGGAAALSGCTPASAWSTQSGPYAQMLFSVWGASGTDVWAVGGCDVTSCPGNAHSRIIHYDGTGWTDRTSPADEVIWWVYGFASNDVWMAGEHGTMLHWDGTALAQVTSGVENTKVNVKLFGLWGASSSDFWVAGGVPDVGPSTVLHWNGTAFSIVADAPPVTGTWYKVSGTAAGDVYLVGQAAAVGHYDGTTWTSVDVSGAGVTRQEPLFTVSGKAANDIYIVGGVPGSTGVAIHYDGTSWGAVAGLPLGGTSGLTGVYESAAGDVAITGLSGAKFFGRPGAWRNDSALEPLADLHAVWFDNPNDVFSAGGNFFAETSGIVAYYGP